MNALYSKLHESIHLLLEQGRKPSRMSGSISGIELITDVLQRRSADLMPAIYFTIS